MIPSHENFACAWSLVLPTVLAYCSVYRFSLPPQIPQSLPILW